MLRIAVIITTYNRPDALAAALEGYLVQSDPEFEVIVADDGSGAETRAVVDEYAARAHFPLRHVWQEDEGFRAAAIRNKAIAATDADYVIFTDGDCVPGRTFVAQHRRLAEAGWFLSANRVLLTERFTRAMLAERMPIHRWGLARWLVAWLRRDINRMLPLVRLPDGAFRRRGAANWKGAKTCNLSATRADLLHVNGLDERYAGWGLEDSDLVIRLLHAGVRHKSARFAAPVFHLWHRENDRSHLSENQERLDDVLHSHRVRAVAGVEQYLDGVKR